MPLAVLRATGTVALVLYARGPMAISSSVEATVARGGVSDLLDEHAIGGLTDGQINAVQRATCLDETRADAVECAKAQPGYQRWQGGALHVAVNAAAGTYTCRQCGGSRVANVSTGTDSRHGPAGKLLKRHFRVGGAGGDDGTHVHRGASPTLAPPQLL